MFLQKSIGAQVPYIKWHSTWVLCTEYSQWAALVKNPPADAGAVGSVPGLGRSSAEGNPPQYSCLGNPMDRESWWATVHGVTEESNTT